MKDKKSSIGGIEANIVVLICYLGALLLAWFYDTKMISWLLPLIVYIVERDNAFIKKHSAQASVLYLFYSIISIIIMFISISMFNITNIFSLNLTNFTGSLLMASTISMIAMLILIVITILTVIVSSKVWHYEDYDIPFIKVFVKPFRKFIDKIMNGNKDKNENIEPEEIIVSSELKTSENDVVLEDDIEVINDANETVSKKIEKDKSSKAKKKEDK